MQTSFAAAPTDPLVPLAAAPRTAGDLASDLAGDLELRVAQMLCARLCHDLMSPANAIHMGLGLFGDAGADDGETVRLVRNCAREVTTRLSFFRLVFGLDRGNAALVWPEALQVMTEMLAPRRITLLWCREDSGTPGRPVADETSFLRLVCCLILLGAESLPRGGAISVIVDGDGDGRRARVSARGPAIRMREDIREGLMATDPGDLTARNVDAYYARRLAQRLGATLSFAQTGDDELRLEAAFGPGPAVNWLGSANDRQPADDDGSAARPTLLA